MFIDDFEKGEQSLVLYGEHLEETNDAECLFYDSDNIIVARMKASLEGCKTPEGYNRATFKVL